MSDQDPGATPDPTAGPVPATPSDPRSDSIPGPRPDTSLGDKGMRALESERTARREAMQRATAAEARVAELEAQNLRREVAIDKGIPADLLQGSTREELEAFADRLLDHFKPGDTTTARRPVGRPRMDLPGDRTGHLVNGAAPDQEPEMDAGKLADQILSNRRL